MHRILVGLAAVSLCACGALPNSMARVRQNAQDLNLDARFGRTELAMARVAESARETYAEHHRAWGGQVRIADIDVQGVRPRGDHDADVMVHVAWYRTTEEELLTTTLKQHWHDATGWQLVDEARIDGAIGLLGEPIVFQAPPEPRAPSRFPTIRLGEAELPE